MEKHEIANEVTISITDLDNAEWTYEAHEGDAESNDATYKAYSATIKGIEISACYAEGSGNEIIVEGKAIFVDEYDNEINRYEVYNYIRDNGGDEDIEDLSDFEKYEIDIDDEDDNDNDEGDDDDDDKE